MAVRVNGTPLAGKKIVEIAAGSSSFALASDGTLLAGEITSQGKWAPATTPQYPSPHESLYHASTHNPHDTSQPKHSATPFTFNQKHSRKKTGVFDISHLGTPGTIRTYDTWFRRPVLYPLSYGCA